MFTLYVEGRLTRYLQRTESIPTADGKAEIRVYECYGAGYGPRRWQKITGLTAKDLRITIAARRKQVAGHQRVIRVYERMLELLEGMSSTAKVGDVIDQVVQEAAAWYSKN